MTAPNKYVVIVNFLGTLTRGDIVTSKELTAPPEKLLAAKAIRHATAEEAALDGTWVNEPHPGANKPPTSSKKKKAAARPAATTATNTSTTPAAPAKPAPTKTSTAPKTVGGSSKSRTTPQKPAPTPEVLELASETVEEQPE